MNTWDESDHTIFAEVDAALRTAPIANVPPSLAPAVLARIQALQSVVRPRFRLTWLDIAIPAFVAGMFGLIVILWSTIPTYVTQQFLAYTQAKWLILSHQAGLTLLGPALLLGAALALAASLTAALLFREPLRADSR